MAFLGWSNKTSQSEILSLKELTKIFDLSDVNKAGAKFSWEKLNWINSQYIKKMEPQKLCNILKNYWEDMGWESPSDKWDLKLTLLIQDSLILLKDSINQAKPFFSVNEIQKDGKEFLESKPEVKEALKYILNFLKEEQMPKINKYQAKEIINNLSNKYSIKKGILMKSLRVAFFGCLSGPDLIESWELLSEQKADISLIERCLFK